MLTKPVSSLSYNPSGLFHFLASWLLSLFSASGISTSLFPSLYMASFWPARILASSTYSLGSEIRYPLEPAFLTLYRLNKTICISIEISYIYDRYIVNDFLYVQRCFYIYNCYMDFFDRVEDLETFQLAKKWYPVIIDLESLSPAMAESFRASIHVAAEEARGATVDESRATQTKGA